MKNRLGQQCKGPSRYEPMHSKQSLAKEKEKEEKKTVKKKGGRKKEEKVKRRGWGDLGDRGDEPNLQSTDSRCMSTSPASFKNEKGARKKERAGGRKGG